jgi:hypothetical protein
MSRVLSSRVIEHHESYSSARQQHLRNAYGDTATKRTQNSISDSRGPARTCCDARHMVRVESYGGQQESAQPPHEAYKFSPERPIDYRTDKDLGLDW